MSIPTPTPPPIDVLEMLDSVLSAALKEVRKARSLSVPPPTQPTVEKSLSQPRLCREVLDAVGRPLHVSALVLALRERGVSANRDSLVSALSKRLAPAGPFVRTAPNTFGLASRDREQDS